MLNNLIESTSKVAENTRRGRFMGMTFVAVATALSTVWTFSLFRAELGMWDGDSDMSSLVSPVAIAEEQPPAPEPKIMPRASAPTAPQKVRLPEFYDSIGKTAPQDTAGKPNVIDATKFDPKLLEKGDLSIPEGAGLRGDGDGNAGVTNGAGNGEIEEAPPVKKPEPVIPKQITGGVVNGKATHLEKPMYSAAAIAIHASGEVQVEVLIDENGRVLSAKAMSGHPLLRGAAEKAAMASRFTPTFLSNQAVKVSGVIIYKFTA